MFPIFLLFTRVQVLTEGVGAASGQHLGAGGVEGEGVGLEGVELKGVGLK